MLSPLSSMHRYFGLRTERYKLLNTIGEDGQISGYDFFDLKAYPSEMNNLCCSPEHVSVLKVIKRRLEEKKQAVGATDEKLPEQFCWLKASTHNKRDKTESKI